MLYNHLAVNTRVHINYWQYGHCDAWFILINTVWLCSTYLPCGGNCFALIFPERGGP